MNVSNNLKLSNHSSSIPKEIRDILIRLNFLSKIKTGKKINTYGKLSVVDSDSWIGAFMRAISHENRQVTLNFIISIIDLTTTAIKNFSNTEFLRILINYLYNARSGIANLSSTYQGDLEFSSSIEVCLASIDMQLNKHKHLIDTIYHTQMENEVDLPKDDD